MERKTKMNRMNPFSSCLQRSLILSSLISISVGAQALTLDEALRMAKERNGAVRAAEIGVRSAESNIRLSKSSFLPTLTPTYRYDTIRRRQYTGTSFSGNDAGNSFDITASWNLWDSGARLVDLLAKRAELTAEEFSSTQTLRQTLFNTLSQYYNAQRTVELLKVQTSQLARSETILKQTNARAEVGDIPRKDTFQAEADFLNAQVGVLSAESRVKTSLAELKATIGYSDADAPLTIDTGIPSFEPQTLRPLFEVVQEGLASRTDLKSRRSQLDSQRLAVRLSQIDNGLTIRLDAGYSRSLARDVSDRSSLALVASFPLFNGGRSREEVLSRRLQVLSAEESLSQAERTATAEIESAYEDVRQSALRVRAASAALVAAQKNYDAASKAQALGASSLVEVVQAQTSLVTAEVNAVEAVFDALIAESRLRLATGQALRGEVSQ
jgi:outer membrane protein